MTQISKYFASLGFDVDKKSLKDVDKALDSVEKRLKRFGSMGNKALSLDFGNFNIDQRKLNMALGNALDLASTRLAFDVNRFVINQTSLNRDVALAMSRASAAANLRVNTRVNPAAREPSGRVGRTSGAVGGGLIGRGVGGLYGPALALGLGGYGLSQLNQRNQQVVAAQLQSQSVVQQAGGSAEQGQQSFEWLRREGDRVGFNYLDASGDYNNLLSGLTGAGMSVSQGQGVFKGFSELSRVNKLDRVRQQRLFRALAQVAGKDQLMSEELRGQISEALPGGVSLFAEAYQRQIGGSLTGSDATKALEQAMKKGQVKGNILTIAGQLASERAQPGLAAASRASQAEQARYQNSVNDLAVVASNAGVEEGFARIFRTLNAGLSESGDLVKGLAEGFNEATKWADDLLLFPQSFIRALEGKDSLVADWLGADATAQLILDWKEIKILWSDLMAIKPSELFGNFLPTIQATAKEISGIIGLVSSVKQWNSNATAAADIVQADISSRGVDPVSNVLTSFAGSIAGLSAYVSTPFNVDDSNQYKDYVSNEYSRGAQVMKDRETLQAMNQSIQFQVTMNIDPVTAAQMDVTNQADALANEFVGLVQNMFEQANVNFPIRE